MRRNVVILALATALLCLFLYAFLVQSEQQSVAARLIRLHIVASSDSPVSQARKLTVRDAVLPCVASLTEGCETKQEALAAIQSGLPEIRAAATQALAGSGETASVTLAKESFPRREYKTFSLPAGRYDTLRLTLGAGEGRNWWCVAFPALCLPATTEGTKQAAEAAGLEGELSALLTEKTGTVQLKFRLLEWLSQLLP